MPFSTEQVRLLKASVRPRHVKAREVEGKTLHYLEGWHVVAEANRIFGFDAWDRETVSSECVWRTQVEQQFAAAYLTRVRIRVQAGERIITREGLGSGEAVAPTPGQAHERASKAAETDATKRALSTFGNSFGLSLYRDKTEPPKPQRPSAQHAGSAAQRVVRDVARRLREGDRRAPAVHATLDPAHVKEVVSTAQDMATEGSVAQAAMDGAASDPARKDAPLRPPHPFIREPQAPSNIEGKEEEPAANELRAGPPDSSAARVVMMPVHLPQQQERPRVDKSVLTLSEPKRRRDREHLRFVARQPCLVCARTPSQAHHLRIAQPRALGRKVSDEFTVPLCALHHHDLHMKGNEAEWWWGHSIDPMPVAEQLWRTRELMPERGEPAAE